MAASSSPGLRRVAVASSSQVRSTALVLRSLLRQYSRLSFCAFPDKKSIVGASNKSDIPDGGGAAAKISKVELTSKTTDKAAVYKKSKVVNLMKCKAIEGELMAAKKSKVATPNKSGTLDGRGRAAKIPKGAIKFETADEATGPAKKSKVANSVKSKAKNGRVTAANKSKLVRISTVENPKKSEMMAEGLAAAKKIRVATSRKPEAIEGGMQVTTSNNPEMRQRTEEWQQLRQRTEEWQQLRQERLTSSAFPSVVGIWGNRRRVEMWAEKLGLKSPFIGNLATEWGIQREPAAIKKYEEITGYSVGYLAFKIYEEGNQKKEWLGASPDGLVDEEGVLEVKCPHNNGKPGGCIPWTKVPYYYMPQLQGLMEILDRDWLDLFVWTVNGSAIFRVERDQKYWDLIFGVLEDFWQGSVVPARKALLFDAVFDVNIYKPVIQHRLIPEVIKESKRLSKASVMINKTLI